MPDMAEYHVLSRAPSRSSLSFVVDKFISKYTLSSRGYERERVGGVRYHTHNFIHIEGLLSNGPILTISEKG